MARARWTVLLLVAACASEPNPPTLETCWAINDAALDRCADDLGCRHAAYADEIAECFDDAGCRALAAWLRCAGAMTCTPGPDCTEKCASKPSECPRP